MATIINFEKLLAIKVDNMSSYLGYSHILSELYSNPNVWDLYTHLKRTNKPARSSPSCRFNDLKNAKYGLDYNLTLLKQRSNVEKTLNKHTCDNDTNINGWVAKSVHTGDVIEEDDPKVSTV